MSKGQLTVLKVLGCAALVTGVIGGVVGGCDQWDGVEVVNGNLVSPNGAITQGADESRTNWYPDQPGLDPSIVGGPNFKRIFSTALPSAGEPVLAQPLVVNGKVLIVTEENNVYLLDANSGAVTTSRSLGAGFDASGTLGCGDIQPHIGITGTPVVDTSSNTAYFFSKSSAGAYTLHGVDTGTLAEKAGFPVTISGAAQNDATKTFNSTDAHQRPGLLLMGGVVYGAFASHCDHTPYVGWIIGVSTAGAIKAMFATSAGAGSGDGIWMSGSGLTSDGAGNILFATGNPQGASPAWPATGGIASNAPPVNLDESAARAVVQANGTLKVTDFFAPFNAQNMGDNDLAGGGIISLPSQFGTTSVPRTAIIVGKAGLFYLLNRDVLGGYQKGAGAGDAVITQINLNGGTWGHPAVWPGDGGYVAVTTNGGANAQTGYRLQLLKYAVNGANPSFTVVGYGTSSSGTVNQAGGPPIDNFGAYAGSPTVTSNGTTAGSAVFWAVGNSNLRAYEISGNNLQSIFSQSIGDQSKFSTVGVGSGTIYVGTGDGHVIAYGAGTASVSGAAVAFGNVTVGQQSTMTATITANQNLTIAAGGLTITPTTFTLGTSTPALPATLTSGQSITVPVTFKPTASGPVTGALNVAISGGGGGSIALSGTGIVNAAQLNITPATVAFGGIVTGTTKQISVIVQNTGTQTLTFATSTLPAAPFSVTGVPANGATLAAGANVTATVTFAPTTAGSFSGNLVVNSNGGNLTIPLTGASGTAPVMVITPLSINFGTTSSGVVVTKSFTIQNTGGTDLQIVKSKPPALGQFVATTTLGEGSAVPAGTTLTETVQFSSTTGGTFNDVWVITGSDNATATNVSFTGVVAAPLSRTGWVATASNTGGTDVPANMLDGNLTTRWSTGAVMAAGMWFQIDMGADNSVGQIVMDSTNSNGDYARAYSVYVSDTIYTGGSTTGLGTAVSTGTAAASPITVSFTAKTGRYITVVLGTVPAGTTSWWSIDEVNAYGTSGGGTGAAGSGGSTGAAGSGGSTGAAGSGGTGGAISRTGWVATASNTGGTDVPANMLDGNLTTRWSTGAVMAAGMWFQVDMGADNSVGQIVMDSTDSNGDYARAYSVYVSDTNYTGGSTTGLGTAVSTGTAAASPVTVSFTAKTGRYIAVVLGTIPAGTTSWWSIDEVNAYGTSGGSTGAAGSGGSTGAAGSGGSTGAAGSGGSSGSVFINAGSATAVPPYVADVDFTGGTTINHANTIVTTGVTNPAPAAVYQTAHIGTFSYTIPGFVAGSSHTVRLHMCETYHTGAGQRTFNVSLNGTQVLTAFDIWATAGATNKAVVQQFTANANASGQFVISFTTIVDNSLISGIEID